MTDKQPEALRLADFLGWIAFDRIVTDPRIEEAEAELRRLQAQNERLKTLPMKYRRMEFNAQLQTENDRLRAQRDELLDALKRALPHAEDSMARPELDIDILDARAAIKVAEEGK